MSNKKERIQKTKKLDNLLKPLKISEKNSALDKKYLSKAVLCAAERAGKQFGEEGLISYLEAQALATPSPFMTLLARAICEVEDRDLDLIHKIEIVAPDFPILEES